MSVIDFQTKQVQKLILPEIFDANGLNESNPPTKGSVCYDHTNKEILVADGTDWFASGGGGGATGEFVTSVSGATTFNITIYWSKVGSTVTLQWRDLNQPLSVSGQAITTVAALPNELRWIGYQFRYIQWPTRVTNGGQNSTADGYVSIDFDDGLITWEPTTGSFTNAWAGIKGSSVTYHV